MAESEARFRQVERVLDKHLSSLRSNTPDIVVRDLSARTYHYKNQVLTWSHHLVRDREDNGETKRISVLLTYSEPIAGEDDLAIRVRAEIFQQGQLSRIDRRHDYLTPIAYIEQAGLEDLARSAFEQGAELLID
jgi:hypothetical protein